MATNLNIDNELLEHAYKLSGLKTKRETVNQALQEFVQHHSQKEILLYLNSVEMDDENFYKKYRDRK